MRYAVKTMSLFALAITLIAAGCSTAPSSNAGRIALHEDVQATVNKARAMDPSIDRFFNESAGYAVFPNVGKGGYVLGGAYGQGMLFENGQFTSYCSLTQGTIGLQIGGQSYSEIIFFENGETLGDFKNEQLAFAAQASAVAMRVGAAANANYNNGVAVFTLGHGGLMAEASIGGQKFDVVSRDDAEYARDYRGPNSGVGTATANSGYDAVYGYAGSGDEQDVNWREDSDYNRGFDLQQGRTIRGEVVSIGEFSPNSNARKGRQITVRGDDGQTYTVHMGPASWQSQNQRVQLREGDRVTVTGAASQFNNNDVIMAQQIRLDDGRMIEVRDAQGRGLWLSDNASQPRNQNDLNRTPRYDGSSENIPADRDDRSNSNIPTERDDDDNLPDNP